MIETSRKDSWFLNFLRGHPAPMIVEEADPGAGTVTTYIGIAASSGAATSDEKWLIAKIVETTVLTTVTTTVQFPRGETALLKFEI